MTEISGLHFTILMPGPVLYPLLFKCTVNRSKILNNQCTFDNYFISCFELAKKKEQHEYLKFALVFIYILTNNTLN